MSLEITCTLVTWEFRNLSRSLFATVLRTEKTSLISVLRTKYTCRFSSQFIKQERDFVSKTGHRLLSHLGMAMNSKKIQVSFFQIVILFCTWNNVHILSVETLLCIIVIPFICFICIYRMAYICYMSLSRLSFRLYCVRVSMDILMLILEFGELRRDATPTKGWQTPYSSIVLKLILCVFQVNW